MPLLLLSAAAEACVCCFVELLLSVLTGCTAPPAAPQHPAYNVILCRTKTIHHDVYRKANTFSTKLPFFNTTIEGDALDGPAAIHSPMYHHASYEVNLARACMVDMSCSGMHEGQHHAPARMSHYQHLVQALSSEQSTKCTCVVWGIQNACSWWS